MVGGFAQGVEELASGILAMKSQESLACIHDFTFIFLLYQFREPAISQSSFHRIDQAKFISMK